MGSISTKSKSTTRRKTINPGKVPKHQISTSHRHGITDLLLIWISHHATEETIVKLRSIINRTAHFNQINSSIEYLKSSKADKVFVIVDESLGETLTPRIHPRASVDSIFLINDRSHSDNNWTKKWVKVKEIHNNIESLYGTLEKIVEAYNNEAIPMSFSSSNGDTKSNANPNELQASFMYTQLFKNVLLDMNHTEQSRQDFMSYCRTIYQNNPDELNTIDEFTNGYRAERAVWWYTRECFIYQMLNRALRLLQADVIVNMGFFINDLHRQLDQLHKQQLPKYRGKTFLLFRGQGMSMGDFDNLRRTQGGLMSFNNFLSTSKKQSQSLEFAQQALKNPNSVGILFVLIIDPNIISTPFADIKDHSFFKQEAEVLFSMHTVFRIREIRQLHNNDRLFKVQLQLTADDDEDLRRLTDQMEKEASEGTAWQRLGTLLIQVGHVNKAEELCLNRLEQEPTHCDAAYYNHQLGRVKTEQGAYKEAIEYHEKALEIEKEKLPPTHPMIVASYISIGLVYSKMAEHSKALNYHNQALQIQKETLPEDHPDLATSYNNIGLVCNDMRKSSEALTYFDKALSIDRKNLPKNHPSFASSYNNIGSVYCKMDDYQKALSHHNQALEIQRKTLPAEHPAVATSLSNIGLVYFQMADYSQALSYYNQAVVMRCQTLAANHPDFAKSYDNIGLVYFCMQNFTEALSYYEKALAIRQETLHADHPDLASSFSNIGSVHRQLRHDSEALTYYIKALEIEEKVLDKDHPDLANSYNNIGTVHFKMEQYADALMFYEKACLIKEKMIPINYASLASCYSNIGLVHRHLKVFNEALANYEKALNLRLQYFPDDHSDLTSLYNGIGSVYYDIKEYGKAVDSYEKSRQIQEANLSPLDSQLSTTYNHLGSAYFGLKDYLKALIYYEKAAGIKERTLAKNHIELSHSYGNLGLVHRVLKDFSRALFYYQRALEILENNSSSNEKQKESIRSSIESIKKYLR